MHHISPVPGRSRPHAPAAVLLLALCLLASGAQALMIPMDDAALATGADEVVRGEIADVRAGWNADHTAIVTTASVKVKGRAKGNGADTLSLTVPGGTVDNVTLWVEDEPVLVAGTEAFVFVKHGAKGSRVYGGSQGVVPVDRGRVRGNGKTKGGGVPADAYQHYIGALAAGAAATPPAAEPAPRAAAGTVPVITGVSPASASAGTGTEVTITGSGFGTRASRDSIADVGFTYRYTGSEVVPIWASGYPRLDLNPDEIVAWSDTRIVVRVPTGITPDGYSGSASSGFLWVLSDEDVPSAGKPFTVTFGDGGANWTAPCTFRVNPGGLSPEMVAAIVHASATWNGALPATAPQFLYGGTTNETTGFFEQDGVNLVSLGSHSDFIWSPEVLAQTMAWRANGVISEADLMFNPAYTWTAANAAGEVWNMEQVSLHEFGHWLRLTDLYGWVPGYPSDTGEVMFGYGAEWLGNKNRVSLAPDDTAGIRWMYPRTGTPPPTPAGPWPYPGPHVVPGTVEAEDFDAGGEGIAYHDSEPANLGGAYRPAEGVDIETSGGITNVGWVRSGEWLNYTVNATAPQSVVLRLHAANPDAATKRIGLSVGGAPAGTIDVSSTGSFGAYGSALSAPFGLSAGPTMLRLSFDGTERINLDRLEIVPADLSDPGLPKPTPTPTPTPTPEPALVISEPGRYTLDHDLASDWNGVLITSSDVVFDGMGHAVEGPGKIPVYGVGRGVAAQGPSLSAHIANVTVRNLTVRHWNDGIRLENVDNATVEGVLAEQNRFGFSDAFSEGAVVRDSVFRDSGFADDVSGAGLHLDYPAGVTIERCSVSGNWFGIYAYESGTAETPHLIADSDISGNTMAGISLTMSGGATVRNDTIRGNGDAGVQLGLSVALIDGNRIEGHTAAGVEAVDGSTSTITGNRIAGNGVGISSTGGSPAGVWNNVLNNTENAYLQADGTAYRLNTTKTAGPNIVGGPFIGGNFWAAPDGTGFSQTHPDADGDGFCDGPNQIADGAADLLPLAVPSVVSVPGGAGTPTSTEVPGLYDDVNGNGRRDFADVVLYFNQIGWIAAHEPVAAFDYNRNGRIDFADVVWLFNNL